jgi:hypothetical protein
MSFVCPRDAHASKEELLARRVACAITVKMKKKRELDQVCQAYCNWSETK